MCDTIQFPGMSMVIIIRVVFPLGLWSFDNKQVPWRQAFSFMHITYIALQRYLVGSFTFSGHSSGTLRKKVTAISGYPKGAVVEMMSGGVGE